jgi:hypothetical protein
VDGVVMKLHFQSMSRGVIYVDENLQNLIPALQNKNFIIRGVPKGTSDDFIMEHLITKRKFVTNNSKDFLKGIAAFEIGLISVEHVSKDPKVLADMIDDAWVRYKLGGKQSFQIILYQNGKHKLKFFE